MKARIPDLAAGRTETLTRRQTQVLRLIAAGYRNKQISRVLGIALNTVSCHRYQLLTKLDVGGVAELTRYPIRAGLIEPAEGGAPFHGTASAKLTQREIEVLELIASGCTGNQIAWELGISPKTVSSHRTSILAKTGSGNTARLVRCAAGAGLIHV